MFGPDVPSLAKQVIAYEGRDLSHLSGCLTTYDCGSKSRGYYCTKEHDKNMEFYPNI